MQFLAIPDWLDGKSESDNIRLAAEKRGKKDCIKKFLFLVSVFKQGPV